MWSFIDSVRHRSEGVRRSIAFFGAVGITGMIVALWLISLAVRGPEAPELSEQTGGRESALSPLRSFAATIGAVISDTRRELAEFKKMMPFSSETVYPAGRSQGTPR